MTTDQRIERLEERVAKLEEKCSWFIDLHSIKIKDLEKAPSKPVTKEDMQRMYDEGFYDGKNDKPLTEKDFIRIPRDVAEEFMNKDTSTGDAMRMMEKAIKKALEV